MDVAKRLGIHINSNNLSNVFQSAYKQLHSTESVLIKVHYDITLNMNNGKTTALSLPELSAAFGTITVTIVLNRLSLWYGLTGVTISCFKSYLSTVYLV